MKKNAFLMLLFCCCLSATALAVCDSLPPRKKPGKQPQKVDAAFMAYLDETIQWDIPIITCEQLKTLQQSNRDMTILDVRTKEEFETSHIAQARRVGYDDFTIERIWALDRNKLIVIYGAKGEASEEIGRRLKQMGFKDVRNLYSSIFEWIYEGGKVVDKEGNATDRVQMINKNRLRFLYSPY